MTNMKIGTKVRQYFSIFSSRAHVKHSRNCIPAKKHTRCMATTGGNAICKKLLWYRLLPLCLAAQSLGESLALSFDYRLAPRTQRLGKAQ